MQPMEQSFREYLLGKFKKDKCCKYMRFVSSTAKENMNMGKSY